MRRLLGTFVVLSLLGLQDVATAGVLWFQTTDRDAGDRTGAGVLTVPRFGTAQIGDTVIWNPRQVLVSSEGSVGELTFEGESIEDTLGVVVFIVAFEEESFAALLIWTPKRVLAASPDGSVDEVTFQGKSIRNTLGVLTLPSPDPELPAALVIWTSRRVMMLGDEGLEEITFEGGSIRGALGAVFRLSPDLSGAGVVIWTRSRVLSSSGGPASELTFEGESIDDTLGVLLQRPPPEDGEEETEEPPGPGLVIWTPDRVLSISGDGIVSQLAFEGEPIRSNVQLAEKPFRRQVESFSTSLYEAEARLRDSRGALMMSNPIFEAFFPPL
jgi:hypothetical protein